MLHGSFSICLIYCMRAAPFGARTRKNRRAHWALRSNSHQHRGSNGHAKLHAHLTAHVTTLHGLDACRHSACLRSNSYRFAMFIPRSTRSVKPPKRVFREALIQSTCVDWRAGFSSDEAQKALAYFVYFKLFGHCQAEKFPSKRARGFIQRFPSFLPRRSVR